MKTEKDFEELFKLFNIYKIKYCIIGAYAVAFYVKPRYTKDIDLFIEPSLKNSKKIIKALHDFGFESLNLSDKDFRKKGNIIQLGYEPIRVDFFLSLRGCSFQKAWKNKVVGTYGTEKVYFIGINELIKIKKMSSRPQDKIDIDFLLKGKNRFRLSK
ncbi:MAG: hypothetical protein WCC06_06215 [Candidatus Aminicenantales bacterium]